MLFLRKRFLCDIRNFGFGERITLFRQISCMVVIVKSGGKDLKIPKKIYRERYNDVEKQGLFL
jgi:hypothetical protein